MNEIFYQGYSFHLFFSFSQLFLIFYFSNFKFIFKKDNVCVLPLRNSFMVGQYVLQDNHRGGDAWGLCLLREVRQNEDQLKECKEILKCESEHVGGLHTTPGILSQGSHLHTLSITIEWQSLLSVQQSTLSISNIPTNFSYMIWNQPNFGNSKNRTMQQRQTIFPPQTHNK